MARICFLHGTGLLGHGIISAHTALGNDGERCFAVLTWQAASFEEVVLLMTTILPGWEITQKPSAWPTSLNQRWDKAPLHRMQIIIANRRLNLQGQFTLFHFTTISSFLHHPDQFPHLCLRSTDQGGVGGRGDHQPNLPTSSHRLNISIYHDRFYKMPVFRALFAASNFYQY